MDGLELELMERLSYDAEIEDVSKTGRKRVGTALLENGMRTSKRQRTRDNQAEVEKAAVGDAALARLESPNAGEINGLPSDRGTETSDSAEALVVVPFKRVLKRIPIDIPYLPVTCEDGTRLYLRLKPTGSEDEKGFLNLINSSSKREKGKLLLEDWEQTKKEARILRDKFHDALARTVLETETGEVNKENASAVPHELWVEKYKPKSFLDLLSQEAVNRGLLHWLKLWDKSVFGNDYLAKVKTTREKYAKIEAREKEKDERFHRKTYLPPNEEYDEGGRPTVKVALLAGDPGLGKTTCAHIIAKHAGYKVREMNASDDRSVELFRKILDDTTESRSEIFQDGRPNCLIIDEIDGAPSPSVNVLVELITGNATESGKKKTKKILRRPVICICNDLFAPSLKLLKKHAFVVQFPVISVQRLIDRLFEVSKSEKLFMDTNTLTSLCQKSECDIRSCLSTLQFLKRRRCSPKDDLFSLVGVKDKSKGIFAVWDNIFTLPEEKSYRDQYQDPGSASSRFRNILQTVQCCGEYEKLHNGVFANYLNVQYRDSYLQTVIEGLEWDLWFENLREYINRSQTYEVMGYLPMYFAMAHFLYARKHATKVQFPNNAEFSMKQLKYQQLVKGQISEVPANVARYLDPQSLITDVFPAAIHIIQPSSIRPVPTQIWTQGERNTLQNVVEIMLSLNLSYSQVKNSDTGAYSFVLEPNLEEFVKFNIQDSLSNKKAFPYSVKQLVAREIETEKLRRGDTIPEVVRKEAFKVPETPKSTPKSKALEAMNKTPVACARDFFGRPIVVSEVSPEADTKSKGSVAVYFRYKEGFSNAVRRYVKMHDLR